MCDNMTNAELAGAHGAMGQAFWEALTDGAAAGEEAAVAEVAAAAEEGAASQDRGPWKAPSRMCM